MALLILSSCTASTCGQVGSGCLPLALLLTLNTALVMPHLVAVLSAGREGKFNKIDKSTYEQLLLRCFPSRATSTIRGVARSIVPLQKLHMENNCVCILCISPPLKPLHMNAFSFSPLGSYGPTHSSLCVNVGRLCKYTLLVHEVYAQPRNK